jgi:hypothetical protein
MGNIRIRKAEFLNQTSLLRPDLEKMFFAPRRKIFLQHYRPIDGVIGRRVCGQLKIWGAALQADGEYEVRVYGLKHQNEKRSVEYFAGLDVSVKDTSVCIVDDAGKTIQEVKVASEPEALLAVLKNPAYHFKRIGLEAGPLSQWLFGALAEAE